MIHKRSKNENMLRRWHVDIKIDETLCNMLLKMLSCGRGVHETQCVVLCVVFWIYAIGFFYFIGYGLVSFALCCLRFCQFLDNDLTTQLSRLVSSLSSDLFKWGKSIPVHLPNPLCLYWRGNICLQNATTQFYMGLNK